ncbi:hypothetical protein [Micromonospora sp. NPDC049891]|uniref:hypothetical protein n=1 Tax=Micromonospora sp. NPDC049891 TaxID=3155655 RepID=UPI0033F77755
MTDDDSLPDELPPGWRVVDARGGIWHVLIRSSGRVEAIYVDHEDEEGETE